MTIEQIIGIINKRIDEKNITKRKLYLDLDIPKTSLYDMLNKNRDLPSRHLTKILEYLDLKIDIKNIEK